MKTMTALEAKALLRAALKKANSEASEPLHWVVPAFGGHGQVSHSRAITLMLATVEKAELGDTDPLHKDLARWVRRVVNNTQTPTAKVKARKAPGAKQPEPEDED